MKPTYFDMTVRDLDLAKPFFGEVLGWQFERFPMPYEYYRIRAGAPSEPGIDGGIGRIVDAPLSAGASMTQITAPVANIDEALERVLHAGGRVVEQKLSIPGVGWYATCAEPGGLLFGLIQAEQSANSFQLEARQNSVASFSRELCSVALAECCQSSDLDHLSPARTTSAVQQSDAVFDRR